MPEGDTVWRQAKVLTAALTGQVLVSSDFRVPAFATVDLAGQTVDKVVPRGKHLMIHVGDLVVHSHLRMEGYWDVYPAAPNGKLPRLRKPLHTVRVILRTQHAVAVGSSLGVLEVLTQAQAKDAVAHLGPDLLGPDWDPAEAWRRILLRPDRAIGLALLDQSNLAGIGNVFRNELCFLIGLHPAAPSSEVPDPARLMELSKRLLEANKDRSNRSTTGGPQRGDAAVWVYGLTGKPCKRCGSLIKHQQLADPDHPEQRARDIFFCPRCQAPGKAGIAIADG